MSHKPASHCVKSKSSSGSGVRRKAAAQPLIRTSIGRDPASRFPFPPIDKARGHVSYDPGIRVTLISTPSPACIGRRRHKLPYIYTRPSTQPASSPFPTKNPTRICQTKQDVTRHAFRWYYLTKLTLMSAYLSAPPPSSFPSLTPKPPCVSWNGHKAVEHDPASPPHHV